MPTQREPAIKVAESWVATIIGVITILGLLAGGLTLIRTTNLRIDSIEKTAIYQRETLDSLDATNTDLKVSIAQINARLDALAAQLAEVKESLARINNLLDQHASTSDTVEADSKQG